jgi:hypothetical protein
MNIWKPIGLLSVAGLVASVGAQIAHADGACHSHGNMAAALDHLREARAALDRAEHNNGGWKDRAIQSTEAAIRETSMACDLADPSGPIAPHRFEAANYWSYDYVTMKGQHDPEACALACERDPRCKVATFCDSTALGGWANTCLLRSQVGPRHTEEIGVRSWVK